MAVGISKNVEESELMNKNKCQLVEKGDGVCKSVSRIGEIIADVKIGAKGDERREEENEADGKLGEYQQQFKKIKSLLYLQ